MNGAWHDEVERAASIDDAVASVKRYLGGLPAQGLGPLTRHCHPTRIKADDDVDVLTSRLAQIQGEERSACDPALLGEVFELMLHASLRIAHLNRLRASGMTMYVARRQMSQMG